MDKKTTRKRTEQITGTVRNDISGMSYDDIANALQDLEIHKVELELQNEELRHIQQSLQESRDRYMDLYDYAPVGYFTINSRSNTIVEVNLTACNLLGVEREKLLKTRFTRYVTPEFADKFYLCRKSCRDSQHSQSCDLKMYRGDCASFWAALELLNLPDSQQLRIAMLDITGRKDVEQRLRFKNSILSQLNDRVVAVDNQMRVTYINETAAQAYGVRAEQVLGQKLKKLYQYRWLTPEDERDARASIAGKGWWRGENIHVKKNGEEIIVESAVTALKDERGKPAGMLAVMRDVTERKHVEIDMIMKDRAIASSIAGIGFTDLQGVITYANDALLIMGGYKEEEVLGEDVQLFFVEENTETILNSIIEKGRWSGELKARRKDGSLFVVYLAAHLVKDKKGMPVCVMTSLTDMTEHKQFELLLQESEKKARQKAEELDTLMRLAPVGICISNDPQCRVIIGNEMANCLYEAEKNENISAGPAGGGYNDLTRRCFKNQRELKPSELPMQISAATGIDIRDSELEVLLPSGSKITILGNASPLFDEKGKVRGAIAAFMDITERKKEREKIKELLIERSKQLKQSRYNFKMLVHTMGEGVLVIDLKGVIKFSNRAAEAIFEVGEDELTGYNFGFPEAEGITEIEVPIGTVVKVMELNTVKVIWENEESYLVALRDITEQKQAMDSIRTLSQRLAEAQEKERRHIGHELHDEVGGALTAIKMMLDRSQKKLGGKAESELHKVNDLVDETMDLVSTLSHNMRPDILDEFGLVEALKWYFERYTERTGIKVCFNQNLHDVKYADNIQTTVYRIIQESLTNAARYAGVDLLTVTIHSNPNVLHVQIEDHGCGFDPLEIAGDSSGITGMQDRATLMGGELFVDSSPGRGTIVICTLPLADV